MWLAEHGPMPRATMRGGGFVRPDGVKAHNHRCDRDPGRHLQTLGYEVFASPYLQSIASSAFSRIAALEADIGMLEQMHHLYEHNLSGQGDHIRWPGTLTSPTGLAVFPGPLARRTRWSELCRLTDPQRLNADDANARKIVGPTTAGTLTYGLASNANMRTVETRPIAHRRMWIRLCFRNTDPSIAGSTCSDGSVIRYSPR